MHETRDAARIAGLGTPVAGHGDQPPWLVPGLACLFFVSGACALVYQTLWLRLLALIFGVTVHAASTVLASFMTGLAVGSVVAGRRADRLRRPLAWFAGAEILVGLTALVTPLALAAVRDVYIWLHPRLETLGPAVAATRFVLAFSVLMVPTALMGATLPLVLRSALTRKGSLGARTSQLYAVNTAGAIAGSLAAGFYLVPFVGLNASFRVAATLNLAVGFIALWLSRRVSATGASAGATRTAQASDTALAVETTAADVLPRAMRRLVLAVFALSGLTSLALEVLWFRVLVIFLRPTTYAFTLMLASCLGGIAAGSALAALVMSRRVDWLLALAIVELGVALAMALSFAGLAPGIALAADLPAMFEGWPTISYLAPLVVASLLTIFPTSLLLGVAFPIGVRLYARDRADEATAARHVGTFYGLNVCGAIAGSLGAGFVLIPALGSRASLQLLASITLAGGLALSLAAARRQRLAAPAAAAIAVALFAWLVPQIPDPFDLALARLTRGEQLLWREEGVQTTVAVHRRGSQRIMYLDGHHQANDSRGTAFVHHRIGWLPVALHRAPSRALVVGLGGGATPGAIARFPGLEVDVVELSPSVVRGAAWFRHINFGLLDRPTVRLRVDDGRNFMLLSPARQYDVVTADVILPHHAGAGNLYSQEYFGLVRRVLRNDGLVLQWIGPDTDVEYKLLMRTFLRVFPHATLWGDGSLLVASKRPLTISRGAFEERRRNPGTLEALKAFGIADFERLLSQYIAGPAELASYVGDGPVLTDDRPRVEYFLSLRRDGGPVDLTGVSGDVARHVRD